MFCNSSRRFATSVFLALCCFLALAQPRLAAAASVTSSGTEFWLGFTPIPGVTITPILFISGDTATTGTVTVPGIAFSQTFTVTPGTATTVTLPANATVTSNETTESLGVHVTAGANVSVYGLDYTPQGTDGYLGLPVVADGTDYLVLGYNSFPTGAEGVLRSQYLIVATHDGTTVNITPSPLDPGCSPVTLTLNAGQTWRHRACGALDEDVTGTHIVASAPIAVYGGHEATNIPDSTFQAANQIVEQMTPTSAWGKRFLTEPFAQRTNGDQFRVLASTAGTQVSINGAVVATLGAGAFYQTDLAVASLIETSQPALVAQYSNSATFDNNPNSADSSEMLVPPLEQYLTAFTVATPDSTTDITTNFVNVIAPSSAVGSTKLDGNPIPAGDFSAIGTTGYSGAQEAISIGSHTLSGPQPFGVFSYGYGYFDNYSYTASGFAVAPIALVNSVVLSPKTAAQAVNTQYCASVAVNDQNGNPLNGIRVDFKVTGVNPTAGFALTDTTGKAPFCYVGQNSGNDAITGTVGSKSDSGSVTWAASPPTVTIAISPTTIKVDQHATLTWSSTNANSCTASGAWTGAQALNNSAGLSESPATAGTYTYTLKCTGAGGSTSNAATLTVQKADTQLTAQPALAQLGILKINLQVSATLTAINPSQLLGGKSIQFTGLLGTKICTAVTAANGVASCGGLISTIESLLGYTATFAGDGGYNGSSARGALATLGPISIP